MQERQDNSDRRGWIDPRTAKISFRFDLPRDVMCGRITANYGNIDVLNDFRSDTGVNSEWAYRSRQAFPRHLTWSRAQGAFAVIFTEPFSVCIPFHDDSRREQ